MGAVVVTRAARPVGRASSRTDRAGACDAIRWLGDPDGHDAIKMGSKAAHLSRLVIARRVPPGFCVTADAHRRSGGYRLSPELRDVILAAYAALASRTGIEQPSVAVRSSIVGGTVTPDSWVVDKSRHEVVRWEIGDKRRMTIAVPGGTREVDVPRLLRDQQSLSSEQVLEIAHLGIQLEASMGWPVDVEYAFARGQLYLLQCRPITSLNTTVAHED